MSPMLGNNNQLHRLCWVSADNASVRTSNPIPAITATPKLIIETSKSPVARSASQPAAQHLASSRRLLHRSVSSTPERAAKSP
jgi:hypothetical protein